MRHHRNDVKKKSIGKIEHHVVTNNHNFDSDAVEIVAPNNNYHKRIFLEELSIKSNSNCVNFKSKEPATVISYTAESWTNGAICATLAIND